MKNNITNDITTVLLMLMLVIACLYVGVETHKADKRITAFEKRLTLIEDKVRLFQINGWLPLNPTRMNPNSEIILGDSLAEDETDSI